MSDDFKSTIVQESLKYLETLTWRRVALHLFTVFSLVVIYKFFNQTITVDLDSLRRKPPIEAQPEPVFFSAEKVKALINDLDTLIAELIEEHNLVDVVLFYYHNKEDVLGFPYSRKSALFLVDDEGTHFDDLELISNLPASAFAERLKDFRNGQCHIEYAKGNQFQRILAIKGIQMLVQYPVIDYNGQIRGYLSAGLRDIPDEATIQEICLDTKNIVVYMQSQASYIYLFELAETADEN